MKVQYAIPCLALFLLAGGVRADGRDAAGWAAIDARPTPQWWCDAKFGIFVHWGIYSVPAYAPVESEDGFERLAEWYQGHLQSGRKAFVDYHRQTYGAAPYASFAAQFTADLYRPDEWAELFRKAGAKYVVLTSKHHDGYALWPSAQSPYYNAMVTGPGRDLAGEFMAAMKKAGLKRGFYYSLLEYANRLYPAKRDGKTYPESLSIGQWADSVNLPQLTDLVERYQPDVIWADGEWDYTSEEHHSERFLSWLFTASPVRDTVVVNDRWGTDCRGRHGGHYTTEYGSEQEKDSKGAGRHPWEECRGIGKSFGYNRFETDADYLSAEQCVELLVSTVSRGGNLLLNVGPDSRGRIPPPMRDRLLAIGRWLSVNGESIYGTTRGTTTAQERRVYATDRVGVRYVLDFRGTTTPLTVKTAEAVRSVRLLGSDAKVESAVTADGLVITSPAGVRPCEYGLVYRIEIE